MRHSWPEDTQCTRVVLEVEDNVCAVCGAALHLCDHRRHRIFTLQGPVEVVCTLAPCSDRHGAAHAKTRALQDRWRNDQARDSSERTIFANKGQACLRSSLDISCRRGSDGHPHDRPCDPAQGQKGSKSHA
jgi:hypothetical protein